jgi:hypothetical protein
MVNVDTVYQRVLAIANKEQRGYITPLEFNLLANQAQKEIFGSYFIELNQALAMPGNESEYSDIVKTLNEKISIFKNDGSLTPLSYVSGYFSYPINMYKLGTLYYRHNGSATEDSVEIQEINYDELIDYNKSPLTKPTLSRPLYSRSDSGIKIFSTPSITMNVSASYIKKPSKVEWGYVVVNEQALYNAGSATNFELHTSEETTLVIKILGLAGIVIQKQELMALGQQA